ncbi:MAG: esterase [Novosphingobium sp. 28-62-57]|uniref:alpha/beta hydrolase n=1 Tax=unclassified Novosphingobium TaxID=2644732 RepID=UPI000BCA2527|nr:MULTISPECIES: alpha/beta hydrolase [unclassified Novosphingobium]OYW50385.1 MAG: esterase [Novosphingobium sp. 12-62-10]OYZ11511.1 MAG: esterase [Novosphingobium sp. 28-62-57]OZA36206.1 MAG: esterase [Novosphingobium sp. 17-62-9]HQS68570.1 alpha/beta hydrolase [Novosphingobium sp.]
MKVRFLASALALMVAAPAMAENGPPPSVPVAAPAEPDAIPLYGDKTPGTSASEQWVKFMGRDLAARNVTRPTITPVLPDPAKATGAAVVVAPGGAFMILAMDHEGWSVARALADRGIAAFVLKYRLNPTPKDEAEAGKYMGEALMKEVGRPMSGDLLGKSAAPADGKAAMAWVQANAAKYGIDPARIGMIGFSAGAMTARRVGLDADTPVRPAFLGYIYGPQDPEPIPANAPPLFNAIALDDGLFPNKGFAIAQNYLEAKRPVEIHGYQTGNHGFGLGVPGTTTTLMIDEFTAWLKMQGFLTRKDSK